jgi:hypothetical protein
MSTVDERIVVITGEALIDLVVAPDRRLDGHPGGGPYNVSRTIGRLRAAGRVLRAHLD